MNSISSAYIVLDNSLQTFLTKDNIVFAMSVIGFLSACITGIKAYFNSRQQIELSVSEYLIEGANVNLYMQFLNHSSAPVSITALYLLYDDKKTLCRTTPQLITFDKVSSQGHTLLVPFHSINFPINIPSHGATSGYVLFVNDGFHLPPSSKFLSLEVATNRRKSLQMRLSLDSARNRRTNTKS